MTVDDLRRWIEAEPRDLRIVTLDSGGRATTFEEWPFHPGQPMVDRRP